MMGTITFSAKRSNPPRSGCAVRSRCTVGMQCTVGVSAKGSTHTVHYAVGAQCAVCTQYAVGLSAKTSNPQWGMQ